MTDEEYYAKLEKDEEDLKESGGRPDKTDKYGYYTYKGMVDKMKELQKKYGSDLIKLETA